MAIRNILLELIDDNPYNPRKHYSQTKVKEMAVSLLENGLLQVPEGRAIDGRVQLAYGHMRLRGFRYNQKMPTEPQKWTTMPVDIKEISDQDMFHFAMEENLRRTDITPIELARCIEAFSQMFPEVLDEDIGKKHNMTAANVSNMKRVLRLPEKILEKIDAGTISFTQGRELLIFETFENGENLMKTAIDGLKIGNKYYGEPNTVEGLQKSIHGVFQSHYRPLDKEWQGHRWDILFDTRAAGCLQCAKMVRTHPTKSATAHFCTDEQCWDRHQQEQHDKAAAEAKARMEAEIARRAAQVIAQEEKVAAPTPGSAPRMIDENTICVNQETFAKLEESDSCRQISEGTAVRKPVEFEEGQLYLATGSGMGKVEAYQLVPRAEFTGEVRTYKVPAGREYEEYYESLRNDPNGFYHGMLVKRGKEESVLVGPEVTFVTKVDGSDISQEMLPGQVAAADETDRWMEKAAADIEAKADERDQQMEETREKANLERPVGELPCETCTKGETCDRTHFHVADDDSGRLVCDIWECDHVSWALPKEEKVVIPKETLSKAREAAGTRAEVLDIHPLYRDQWSQELKGDYVLLNNVLREMDDPEECTERCVKGFHYAFDSGHLNRTGLSVCTDPKCVSKKKAALTRKRNAEGQARKKAEVRAVKKAVNDTFSITRSHIKVILLAQIEGSHVERTYYGGEQIKRPSKWLWDKVSAGTKDIDRTKEKLFKAIDKLTNEDLASLVIEMMFYYLMDHGDVGTYEIKTEVPLGWLGLKIELEEEKEPAGVEES